MEINNFSDEIPIDLITHDFNSRSFFLSLRRQNELYSSQSFPRGFNRLNKSNTSIPSHMISQNGITITDNLSKELLDDNLSTVRHHWKKSQMKYSSKIKSIQYDFNSHANISLKKAMCNCQVAIFNWISKNKSR